MVARCTRPSHAAYENYGKRGIHVYGPWLGREGFANFLADMGECPPGLTLERENNDRDYVPSNCNWATRVAQTRNRRCTVEYPDPITGHLKPIPELVGNSGVSQQLFLKRMRAGMSIQEALKPAVRGPRNISRSNAMRITYKDETLTLAQWEVRTGLARRTLAQRIKLSWTPEEILETPSLRRKSRLGPKT